VVSQTADHLRLASEFDTPAPCVRTACIAKVDRIIKVKDERNPPREEALKEWRSQESGLTIYEYDIGRLTSYHFRKSLDVTPSDLSELLH
jgi:hypothetical protein